MYDVGDLIQLEARAYKIPYFDKRFLDMDNSQLRLLRAIALQGVELAICKEPDIEIHLIGIHATFRWKGRLIPGIEYQDIFRMDPTAFVNVVDDVSTVLEVNRVNPKWDEHTLPDLEQTQEWMMVEEFVTEILADVKKKPMYLVAKNHNIPNITDLILTDKKKIYLSYPITAVQESEPQLLEKIQGPILEKLEELFVVFNPMAIEDMPLVKLNIEEGIPELIDQLTPGAIEFIKARTIERDFQFIDQSDAVVVFYMTDKVSPGVLAEIYYAKRNQTPVFMVFPAKRSPFIEDAVTTFEDSIDGIMPHLTKFANS